MLIIITFVISILIATKNRPSMVRQCVQAIQKTRGMRYEILVLDQSDTSNILLQKKAKKDAHIRYFYLPKKNKSQCLALGIVHAKGNIVAFTDDDCLVDDRWLETLLKTFSSSDCDAVFGQVLPFQEEKNRGKVCPCTVQFKKKEVVRQPRYHVEIGYGNNMAFRREALVEVGPPKSWLGPGSVGRAAEDAELTLRALVAEKKIVREPKLQVFHNRWLTQKQMDQQNLAYVRGEAACYGYLFLQGHMFAQKIFLNGLLVRLKDCKKTLFSRQFFQELLLLKEYGIGAGVAVLFFGRAKLKGETL